MYAVEKAKLSKLEQFGVIFFLFIIIWLCNVAGLLPYAFTVTATLIAPLFLAYIYFV